MQARITEITSTHDGAYLDIIIEDESASVTIRSVFISKEDADRLTTGMAALQAALDVLNPQEGCCEKNCQSQTPIGRFEGELEF